MKLLIITATGVLGDDKAIVSSGGISVTEVNLRTMQSGIHPEIIYRRGCVDINNVDYQGLWSFQLCWTTGFVTQEAALLKFVDHLLIFFDHLRFGFDLVS